MKSFLMIGQSNMAGRGDFGEVPEIVNPYCCMLRNGKWTLMSEPVNPDRCVFGTSHSGVSLATSFADEYAKHFNERVGLIPCADGGTGMSEWLPGTVLYRHAVFQAGLAAESSEIAGILWHQGEKDSRHEEDFVSYREKFLTMISSMKKDLSLPDNTPLLIGGLGDYLTKFDDGKLIYVQKLNELFAALAKEIPSCAFVSAAGLTSKPDGLHFNSKSCREFGKRYFEEYLKIR